MKLMSTLIWRRNFDRSMKIFFLNVIQTLKFSVFLLVGLFILFSCRKSNYLVNEAVETVRDNGGGTGTVTWSADKSYLLEGLIFVNDGQVLTIEAGTVIRAKAGQGSAASALIVARGGQIIAQGTSDKPIIFTSDGDDLAGSVPIYSKGLWGGLIILGNAVINISSGEDHIEGIPLYESRGVFGGLNDQDNSGVLSYISIRHGGTNIGDGNEINGLTLGGVGKGTLIDHIEIISNADDGIEMFGGTARLKYVSVAFCGDDAIDFDLGYRGYLQFVLAIQEPGDGDKLIEGDGGTDPITGSPFSMPLIYNGTFIGRGEEHTEKLATFGRNAGGIIANSIFANQAHGIFIEYVQGSESSFEQFLDGQLQLKSNIFFHSASDNPDSIFRVQSAPGVDISQEQDTLTAYFSQALNTFGDPGFVINPEHYNVIPQGDVYGDHAQLPLDWFDPTIYKGAFYTYDWLSGWTLLSGSGMVN